MENVRDAISSAIQTFTDAFRRGDAAAIAALYAEGARLLPPGNPMMQGREAARTFWQGAMGMGIKEARLEALEIEERGDLAYEMGRFEMVVEPSGGQRSEVAGKYVVVWKQEGGAWKIHVDIWNTDRPA